MTTLLKPVNICVVGVSGAEGVKGSVGVGKSLLCNRFVRPAADDFHVEHCSVLSQTDFGGSPVINNDHWLYWGDRLLISDDNSQIIVRIAEQTEFLDDETYEPIACSSKSDEYSKRCCRLQLNSRDKLMYIQKEQLGLEDEFPQQTLCDGKFSVDGFVLVCDVSRNLPSHNLQLNQILTNLTKTKKPIVVAFSKCDEVNEEAKRTILNLLATKKEIKNLHQPPIEISAIHDVNVEELFNFIVGICSKNFKHKRKPLSYYEAAHLIEQRNILIKNAYLNLLSQMMPMNSWPTTHRFGWKRLLSDLDRQPDFKNFVKLYGTHSAHRLYEKYMSDAREYWFTSRLRQMIPHLPKVLRILFEKIDVCDIEWPTAREMILSHALFDDFFQPIGQLGRQLDPIFLEQSGMSPSHDVRLPAEILMLQEAKKTFELFKEEMREVRIREKLEENFEYLLSETSEVTPGKSLNEASLFLQGSSAFEDLPHSQAVEVYERYQRMLVKRAEAEFVECLLEYVELLTTVVQNSTTSIANEAISINDLTIIKDCLEQDRRYRWMSKIFDLRDHLIYSMTSFYRLPSTSKCPAGGRCIDSMISHCLDRFFHRRDDQSYTHLIDIIIHGEINLVAQFISELNSFLQNKPFLCSGGSSYIRCYRAGDEENPNSIFTNVYLIDSISTLESFRRNIQDYSSIPPILVAICDPSNYDVLPMLHQQAASLAAKTGASFFGARGDSAFPIDDIASTNIASDSSSLLGRDQLMSVCEAVCSSQLTLRKRDVRVQMSIMCGDPFSIDSLISNTFGDFHKIPMFRPIVHPNLTAGGIIPIDVWDRKNDEGEEDPSESKIRVELAFGSYHSWFAPTNGYKINSTHAHILVYYVKRPASFEHARTAICRLLDRQDLDFITPNTILLLAITDHNDNQDPLLIEGAELCESIGAQFLVCHCGAQNLTDDFVDFFVKIRRMILNKKARESQKLTLTKRDETFNNDEQGYSNIVEHIRPTSLNLSTMTTSTTTNSRMPSNISNNNNASTTIIPPGSNYSYQSIMTQPDTIDKKMKKKKTGNESIVRSSALKSRISRSGPIFLPQCNKNQPDIQIAPLATPEAIEIAPEYSLVKDAITASNEGVYETLDFGENAKKSQHLDLPTSSSNIAQVSRRHARDSRRSRTTCVSSSPDPTSRLHRTTNLLHPTANNTAAAKVGDGRGGVRQSLSVESLAEILKNDKKEKRSNRFVRKVATSFRFRKDKIDEKREEGRKSEERTKEPTTTASMEQIAAFREKMASRSLPQSPHMDRRTKIYTTLNNTGEKVSSAFSWLPSRSPKRPHKDKSATYELNSSISSSASTTSSNTAQGVIGSDENLETLCSSNPIPIYVEKCVQFIENNGGFEQEGLYRVPGNQAHLADVERKFLQTGEFDVSSVDIPVHVAATALKNFFSCLPTPLIPLEFHQELKSVTSSEKNEDETVRKLQDIFCRVPNNNRNVLKYLTRHLTRVSNSAKTAMDLKNLSKVWFPTLFRPAFDSYEALSSGMVAYQQAMEAIFVYSDRIFQ